MLLVFGVFLMMVMVGGVSAEIEDISNLAIKEYSASNNNCIDGKDKTEIHYYWLGFNEYNKLDIGGKYELMNISGITNWFSNCNQNTKFRLIFDPEGAGHNLEFTKYKSDLIYSTDVKMEYGDEFYWGSVHGYSDYWFDNSTNMDFYRIFLYFDLNGYNNTGYSLDFISYPNSNSITGYMKIHLRMKNGVIQPGSLEDNLIVKRISNNEQRISALESWKATIDTWKTTLTSTINTIQTLLTGHTTRLNNHETRITIIENESVQNNTNDFPNYFKYLGSSDRKAIICGYAQDNHLTQINDLGFNCTIKYTPLRNGGEKAYCKCVGK